MTLKVGGVMLLWVVLIFDPHWFLVARGAPSFILRVQSFLPAAVIAVVLAFDWNRIRMLLPLMAYAAFVAIYSYGFASYPGLAEPHAKEMVVAMILAVATMTVVRQTDHIRTIVLMLLLLRFAWFGLIGVGFGGVRFDPYLANQYAFGALMAAGVVAASAVALAATDRRLRWAAGAVALLSIAGVISSFARGAFLATAISIALLWIRAEGRRLAYVSFLAAVVFTTVIVGSSFSNVRRGRTVHQSFWSELSSITDDIADTEAEDRRLIWRIGWQVFQDHQTLGAGPGAWSTYACQNYTGPILGESRFARRPERLCGRAMHNVFLERLADLGIVGTGLFCFMLIDYWRRILAIRRATERHDTSVLPGLRTKMIATAFEVSMVAILLGGLLYNSVRISFYGLVVANALFHRAWASQQIPARGRQRPSATRARGRLGVMPRPLSPGTGYGAR
jgi:O-antigen ligase